MTTPSARPWAQDQAITDSEAFSGLVKRHANGVYALCRQVLRHPQDAEDACQEVFLKVLRRAGTVEEPDRFASWLYRTTLRTAIDYRRGRSRRRLHEVRSSTSPSGADPASEGSDALEHALARLDEVSRALVIEHHLGGRPLRELAAERGCSEVAVWKRIEGARKRLREYLGSTTMSSLEGSMMLMKAPERLIQRALDTGMTGPRKVAGIKIGVWLVAPPVLSVLLLGAYHALKPIDPPQTSHKLARPLKQVGRTPTGTQTAALIPALQDELPSQTAGLPSARRAKKPYPLQLPPLSWNESTRHTWNILESRTLALDETTAGLDQILQRISLKTGIPIALDEEVHGSPITIKMGQCRLPVVMKFLLSSQALGYEIRPDGSLLVTTADKVGDGVGREVKKIEEKLQAIARVCSNLNEGWDGLDPEYGAKAAAQRLKTLKITARQGEHTFNEERYELTKLLGCPIELVGLPVMDQVHLEMKKRLTLAGEVSGQQFLSTLAQDFGLISMVDLDGTILLATRAEAERRAFARTLALDHAKQDAAILDRPLSAKTPVTAPDLVELLQATGQKVIASQEVWDGDATSGEGQAGLRQIIGRLKIRWALRDGVLYLVK